MINTIDIEKIKTIGGNSGVYESYVRLLSEGEANKERLREYAKNIFPNHTHRSSCVNFLDRLKLAELNTAARRGDNSIDAYLLLVGAGDSLPEERSKELRRRALGK